MIKLEFPKTNLNAYESAEDKVKALKGQVDTLSTNLQIILDSIDESIDEDAIRELVSPDIDSINRGMSEISDRVTDIEDADYGTRVGELESHDFIVEQGTSGIWTYRKWNSGIAECWGYASGTSISMTTHYGALYYGALITQAFPTGLFTSAPSLVQVQAYDNGNGTYASIQTWTKDNVTYYPYTTASATYTTGFIFNIKGRWK